MMPTIEHVCDMVAAKETHADVHIARFAGRAESPSAADFPRAAA